MNYMKDPMYKEGFKNGHLDAKFTANTGVRLTVFPSIGAHYARGYRDGQQAYRESKDVSWAFR